jgi:pimeloyl-ACP methyl ester carboxylesterase
VTALDLSGHGDSGRRPQYRFDLWAEEIATVAAATGSADQPPVIVAHSLGGFATFQAAAAFGERFEGVIIIDSPVREPSPEQEASSGRKAFGPLRVYPSREAILSRFRTIPEQPSSLPAAIDHIAATSIRRIPEGWTWKFDPTCFLGVGEFDPHALARVGCRVAILRPEFGLVTADIGEHMYELLGRTAPVIEVPLAHHHVMLDQPMLLITAIRSLLADWRHSYAMKALR